MLKPEYHGTTGPISWFSSQVKGFVFKFLWDCLLFIMRTHILVTLHLYVEIVPWHWCQNTSGDLDQNHGCWCPGPLHGSSAAIISMRQCKKYITPLRQQWSYAFLALTHQYWLCCLPGWSFLRPTSKISIKKWCKMHEYLHVSQNNNKYSIKPPGFITNNRRDNLIVSVKLADVSGVK